MDEMENKRLFFSVGEWKKPGMTQEKVRVVDDEWGGFFYFIFGF